MDLNLDCVYLIDSRMMNYRTTEC